MNIKIRQLEIFRSLMESGSISQAAQRLNCAQPTVSVALSNLEAEVGFSLFHRSKGFLAPTEEAILLYQEVERSLISIERVKGRILDIREGGVGQIRIATHGAPSVTLLPRAVSRFVAERPDVEVNIQVRSSMQIALWAEGQQIDIGIVEAPTVGKNVEVRIMSVPCVCILPRDHALAARASVGPADLAGEPIIGVGPEHSLDQQLEQTLTALQLPLRHRVYGYFFSIVRQLVRNRAGIAVIDAMNGISDVDDGVVWRPFLPAISYDMAVITPALPSVPSNTACFLGHLEDCLADVVAQHARMAGPDV